MGTRSTNFTLSELEHVVNLLAAGKPAYQVGQMIGKSTAMIQYMARRYTILEGAEPPKEKKKWSRGKYPRPQLNKQVKELRAHFHLDPPPTLPEAMRPQCVKCGRVPRGGFVLNAYGCICARCQRQDRRNGKGKV